jgi:hypothetical protein
MEKLNALDWADGVCYAAYGVRLGLRVTERDLLPELLPLLPPDWKPATTRRVQWVHSLSSVPLERKPGLLLHRLHTGGGQLARGSDLGRVKAAFGRDVRRVLAYLSAWRTFVHAGAVGWRGKAIVLPGPAESGKSVLTAALVRAGATLYSDEFAILDRRGRVHPYPLPVRMLEGEGPRSRPVPVEELGGRPGTKPLPVGMVLQTRYEPRAEGRLQRLSPGRAALVLMSNTMQGRRTPERVMETVGRATADAICLQGPRHDAGEFVDTILGFW